MATNDGKYKVDSIIEIARGGDVWVREFTVAQGEEVPWHRHTEVQDRCYGLEGVVRVESSGPGGMQERLLRPGESCVLPAGTRHRLTCAEGKSGKYLLVQVGRYDFVKELPPA